MILADKEKVIIKGKAPVVWAEITSLLSDFNEKNEEEFGKEKAEEIFNMIVEDAKRSEEELDKEIKELKNQAKDLMKDILETIMKGMGE